MNFDRVGKKIKDLVKILFYIQLVVYGIIGLSLALMGPFGILIGIVVFGVGALVAWISSWMLYGYGEIIDKVCDIEINTRGTATSSDSEEKISDYEAKKDAKKGKCDICGKESVPVVECEIKDSLGTRYRNVCEDCRNEKTFTDGEIKVL